MPTALEATNTALANTNTYGGFVNAGGIASIQAAAEAGTAAASAGTGLFGIDPASIIFSLALRAMGIGDAPSMVATPMTPEQRELSNAAAKVNQALAMQENTGLDSEAMGAGAYLLDAYDAVSSLSDSGLEFFGDTKEQLLSTLDSNLSDRDLGEVLSILKAYPAAVDFDFNKVEETISGGGGASSSTTNTLDDAANAALDSNAAASDLLAGDSELEGDLDTIAGTILGGGDTDLTGTLDTTSSTVDSADGNLVQDGADSTLDTTGWVRTSELGSAVMTYENATTGETFDIDMTDWDALPANEKAAITEVDTRTTNTATTADTSGDTEHSWVYSAGGVFTDQVTGEVTTVDTGGVDFVEGDTYSAGDGQIKDSSGETVASTDGTTISGVAGPAGAFEATGDVFGTGNVNTANIVTKGDTGDAVLDGLAGNDGLDGTDGRDGTDGGDGGDGKDGRDGKDGKDGLFGRGSRGVTNMVFNQDLPKLDNLPKSLFSFSRRFRNFM